MKSLTIYTPTYNRSYLLSRLYKALVNQTSDDFIWLVIDDGSTDQTEELISSFIKENIIDIRYIYKLNGGKQDAVNVAHEYCNTELNVCWDSDDIPVTNAVEKILLLWNEFGSDKLVGIIGLDVFQNGKIVGTRFPASCIPVKFSNLKWMGVKGDKKYILRTEIVKALPVYPSISNERFPAPGYLYRLADQKYDWLAFNVVLSIVEYLPDGISKNKLVQLRENPNAFAFYRKERVRLAINIYDKILNIIHYMTCVLLANKSLSKLLLKDNLFLSIILLPFGFILYIYINFSNKKGLVK